MIYLGADHGGFELKEKVKKWLEEWCLEYQDLGAHEHDPDDDYTIFAQAVARKVDQADDVEKPWGERPKGILLCRSGGGMIIAANRFSNVRAVYVDSPKSATHSRIDNDANIISLAGDWISDEDAKASLKDWLETPFSGAERQLRRRGHLSELPKHIST